MGDRIHGKLVQVMLSLVVGFILYTGGFSQQPQQPPASRSAPADTDPAKDDILILVNLTAKELKFDAVPDPKVEFPGTQQRTTVWVTDRYNLPDKLEPGVTYRNFGITLRISSRFADIERIVREALGEVPAGASQQMTGTAEPPRSARTEPPILDAKRSATPGNAQRTRGKIQ